MGQATSTIAQPAPGWREVCYRSSQVRVFDVHCAPAEAVRVMGEHSLSLLLDRAIAATKIPDARLPSDCPPGAQMFMPARLEMITIPRRPFREVVVPIDQHWFVDTCGDLLDPGKVNFEFRRINDPLPGVLAGALRGIVMDPDHRDCTLLVESAMTSLVAALIRVMTAKRLEEVRFGACSVRGRRVQEYIDANLHRTITLDELAGVAARSKFHFLRAFRETYGVSPLRYVTLRRIDAAKRMLQSSNDPIAEIADACGFSSQSHMTTVFKKIVGVTPAAFRIKSA